MADIKKTVQIDLEVDTTQTDSSKNPYQKVIMAAKAIDAWRLFPRMFIGIYIFILYKSTMWFMTLDEPSVAQAGLISVVTGIGAAWFALYVQTGNKDKRE